MKTNDIKKGMRIVLRNGWEATMKDYKRGNIRMAAVDGFIYAHDIAGVLIDGRWVRPELTPEQTRMSMYS